jgi:diphosphomevalonate decarboxylase
VRATARANSNIAFVKYWGKRDERLNLPARGSLSLTLQGLTTTTTVTFGGGEDRLVINGALADDRALRKALRVVDLVRQRAGIEAAALIESQNSFPTGAGLASSASGLAALAAAAARAAGLALSPSELSALARVGSGSACRSVFGGYVEWRAGNAADGSDSHAYPLYPAEYWELGAVVALISGQPKGVDSTAGMRRTVDSSPYQAPFLEQVDNDLAAARVAIGARDLTALARVAERSCLRMHAAMIAADPPLIYLRPESWAVIEEVRRLRAAGTPAFFTADAGPNVKVFCAPDALEVVDRALTRLTGVQRTMRSRPGGGAEVIDG